MPGFLLHQGASVMCSHGGQATPTVPSVRVKVAGQALVTAQAPHTIAGCAFVSPAGNGPCVIAQWIPPTAAVRVRSDGAPVLLQSSMATCTPTGTPLLITVTQARVKGV